MYVSTTPRRRRRRWWIPLLVTIGGVLIVAAVSIRSDTRELVGFFDTTRRLADAEAARAEVFQDLIRRELDEVSRDRFMTLLQQLSGGVEEGLVELESSAPPLQASGPYEVLHLSLESWGEGLMMFESALLATVDEPQSPLAEADLDLALTRLRVGDRSYERFLESAASLRSSLDVDIGDLPVVAYLAGTSPITAGRLAQSAQLSPSLALVVDVAISTVRISPEEISEAVADVRVVPATDVIDVQVVVANNGNRTENAVRVLVRLSTDGGELLVENSELVEKLQPGAQQTAMFPGLPVTPSQAYDLAVVLVPVPGELAADTENNVHDRRFLVNESVEA